MRRSDETLQGHTTITNPCFFSEEFPSAAESKLSSFVTCGPPEPVGKIPSGYFSVFSAFSAVKILCQFVFIREIRVSSLIPLQSPSQNTLSSAVLLNL